MLRSTVQYHDAQEVAGRSRLVADRVTVVQKAREKFQDCVVDLTLTLFCAWSHWKINGSSLAAADLLWGVGGCLAGELALAASPRPRWLSVQGLRGCHLLSARAMAGWCVGTLDSGLRDTVSSWWPFEAISG